MKKKSKERAREVKRSQQAEQGKAGCSSMPGLHETDLGRAHGVMKAGRVVYFLFIFTVGYDYNQHN